MQRRLTSTILALTAGLVIALASPAAADVTDGASALRGGDTVYVDPSASDLLSSADAATLTDQANATGLPLFIAVLPENAGPADEVLVALNAEVGMSGVYAVVVGNEFRAGSTSGSAADLATAAFRAQGDNGAAAVLSEFITLVDERFGAGSDSATPAASDGGGAGTLVVLLLLIVGGAVVVIVLVRRQRRQAARQLATVRSAVDLDITEYGERLAAVDLAAPGTDAYARADLQRALDDYDRARFAVASMKRPEDAAAVTAALEDGRYALACAEARQDGLPIPDRRPPCFIDPRHGPSAGDVLWAPPGLGPRDVPLCAACRTTVESGGVPAGLDVETLDGERRPYYQAGPQFGPYAQGYYSPFSGVMGAVLVGTMLSSMWYMPGITAAPGMDTAGLGGGDGGFGGGFGGFDGGFGGGDFGGGDFGGGDF